MALTVPGFVPAPGDALTMRTPTAFCEVIGLLLRAGVTTAAEAAFQDPVWRQHLAPLLPLARLRVVQCTVNPQTALRRVVARSAELPARRAHTDRAAADPVGFLRRTRAFARLTVDARPSTWTPPTATARTWSASPRLSAAQTPVPPANGVVGCSQTR